MKSLLQIEWMKVKSYRTFWVLMGLFLVAVIGMNYIVYKANIEINKNMPLSALTGSPFTFPNVWNTITWMSSWLLYFPGFVMVLLISNEYTFKTHRQNVIDGLSRKQFVSIKLMVAFILSLISTIVVLITTILFGIAGGGSVTLNGIEAIGYFFICSWVYILLAMLLAFLFRKAVLAIGVYFIFGMILDNLLSLFLRWLFNGKPYGNYMVPLDVADSLLKHPFRNQSDNFWLPANIYICLGICVAWIIFYHVFTTRKFQGEDL